MTVLSDFIREVADELDARAGKPWRPLPHAKPHDWIGLVKALTMIDRDETHAELRREMEAIVKQEDVSVRERCRLLLPLLLRLLPPGSVDYTNTS